MLVNIKKSTSHRQVIRQINYSHTRVINFFFYGLGSKIHVMEDFVKNIPGDDTLHTIINGFIPDLDFKKTIEQIFSNLSLTIKKCKTLNDHARLIVDHLTTHFDDDESPK